MPTLNPLPYDPETGEGQFDFHPSPDGPDEAFSKGVQNLKKAWEGSKPGLTHDLESDTVGPVVPVEGILDLGGVKVSTSGDEANSQESVKPPRVAFGRYLKPETYDPESEFEGIQVADEVANWFNNDMLRFYGFGSSKKEGISKLTVNGVLMTPAERAMIVSVPHLFKERVAERTAAASTVMNRERLNASERAGDHSLEAKIDKMSGHVEHLKQHMDDIYKLRREAQSPGYAHYGPQNLQALINTSWKELMNFIDTLHYANGWSDEQKKEIQKAAIDYYSTGKQSEKVAKWQGLLEFQKSHMKARANIMNQNIRDCRSALTSVAV